MNLTDIKAIVIGFVTSDGSRHELEIQIIKKTSVPSTSPKMSQLHKRNNHISPNELPPRFSHERLTVKEVAERLRVHPWTVYMWARSGRLPCIRLSKRSIRFLEKDIAKYEREHTTGRIR
jgi:excisionase family DNA binding protein